MTGQITPRRFHQAARVEDWRALSGGACASFSTRSFALGVALMDEIGKLAELAYRGLSSAVRDLSAWR